MKEYSAEDFTKKPENQEELNENIKILKELPELISEPKVVVKLDEIGNPAKYVDVLDKNGRRYIIALPQNKKPYHRDIVSFIEKLYSTKVESIKGGYIKIDEEGFISLYGSSEQFGESNHIEVSKILKEKFPNIKILPPDGIDPYEREKIEKEKQEKDKRLLKMIDAEKIENINQIFEYCGLNIELGPQNVQYLRDHEGDMKTVYYGNTSYSGTMITLRHMNQDLPDDKKWRLISLDECDKLYNFVKDRISILENLKRENASEYDIKEAELKVESARKTLIKNLNLGYRPVVWTSDSFGGNFYGKFNFVTGESSGMNGDLWNGQSEGLDAIYIRDTKTKKTNI